MGPDEQDRPFSIHKRPSGGRGEYELVGRDPMGRVIAADLDNIPFMVQTPFGLKEANVQVGIQGGKRRFRLIDGTRTSHLATQLAAAMMMPDSTRDEENISRGLPVMLEKRYVIDIEFDFVHKDALAATIKPVRMVARSGDIGDVNTRETIDIASRARQVSQVHHRIDALPPELRPLIREHREALGGVHIPSSLTRCVREIMKALAQYDELYIPGGDSLFALLTLVGAQAETEIPLPSETPTDAPEVRLRAEHIYRLRKARGATAVRFRKAVQLAYDYRCAFCGLRAPAVPGRMQSGVDAAHILPWGNYDLDVTQNGLMLCKQHHWAFDNRVLRVDPMRGSYGISLVDSARELFAQDLTTLQALAAVCGQIDESYLPRRRALRPSPTFLEEFNALAIV